MPVSANAAYKGKKDMNRWEIGGRVRLRMVVFGAQRILSFRFLFLIRRLLLFSIFLSWMFASIPRIIMSKPGIKEHHFYRHQNYQVPARRPPPTSTPPPAHPPAFFSISDKYFFFFLISAARLKRDSVQ